MCDVCVDMCVRCVCGNVSVMYRYVYVCVCVLGVDICVYVCMMCV